MWNKGTTIISAHSNLIYNNYKNTNNNSKLKLIIKFISLLFSIFLLFYLLHLLYLQYLPILPDSYPAEITLPFVSSKFDEEWVKTLAYGEINHVEMWNPYGLSEKFKVIFKNGMVASGKFMEPFSLFEKHFRPFTFRTFFKSADKDHKRYSRRAWAEYQGWNELGAYYVDRALGWNRKPPTSGRMITNKQLYALDNGIWSILKRMMPEYNIPVALIAWTEGLSVKPPGTEILKQMLHDTPMQGRDQEKCAQVSDVLIFDYLVDDHDRIEAHNWLKDISGNYIFWDSGLAFRHGPHGRRDRDREIFCGMREWTEITKKENNNTCRSVCMFRDSTVQMIKQYEVGGELRLSQLTYKMMLKDPLFPIFQYNAYLPNKTRYPKVSYRMEDFLEGLDTRVHELLKYIAECETKHGHPNVFI